LVRGIKRSVRRPVRKKCVALKHISVLLLLYNQKLSSLGQEIYIRLPALTSQHFVGRHVALCLLKAIKVSDIFMFRFSCRQIIMLHGRYPLTPHPWPSCTKKDNDACSNPLIPNSISRPLPVSSVVFTSDTKMWKNGIWKLQADDGSSRAQAQHKAWLLIVLFLFL
jgi:hypothetical protein